MTPSERPLSQRGVLLAAIARAVRARLFGVFEEQS